MSPRLKSNRGNKRLQEDNRQQFGFCTQVLPAYQLLASGEFGGTRFTLTSASESLDEGKTGALLQRAALLMLYVRGQEGRPGLGEIQAAEEVARMVLGALRDPDPVAPSGRRSLNRCPTPALSLDEALEEVTGWVKTGSDRDM